MQNTHFDRRIYLFAGGHFAVDWAQSAIPALLPYFISVCNSAIRMPVP